MAVKKTTYTDVELVKTFIKPSHITGKKFYLYIHTRPDNEDLFYIGVGTIDRGKCYYRALCHKKRNNIWHKIVRKLGAYNIFIVEESDSKEDILSREIQYIKLMGKKCNKSGTLSNLTDGGEGCNGHSSRVWTEDMRNKIREANKRRVISDETREKLRIALKKRGIINKSITNGNKETSINDRI